MIDLVPLAFVLPLAAAALLGVVRTVVSQRFGDILSILAAATTTIIVGLLAVVSFRHGTLIYWFGGWRPHQGIALGIDFVVDPFSAAVATLAGVLTTASFCYAWKYFDTLGNLFPTLVLVFLAAMVGYCFSGDLFTLFVFFELMSTAAYALTAYKIEADSLEGALAFAIVNSLGALLFLWGLTALYGRFGALNLAQLGAAVTAAGPPTPLTIAALALLSTGFLVKAACVPFHFWHADADAVAPVPVCVLISGIMAPLGLYGLGRIYGTVFAGSVPASGGVWTILLWVGGATALIGAIMATRQRQFKRLLAFSTIGHVGMMLAGLASFVAAGVGGMLVYLIGHGLIKGALFLVVGVVLDRLGSVDLPALHGRGRQMNQTDRRWAAILLVLGAMGLAGVPPFATFAGKVLMERAQPGAGWLPYVFTITSGLTAGAVLRAGAGTFLGWGRAFSTSDTSPAKTEGVETTSSGDRVPVTMLLVPSLLLGAAILLGLIPQLARAAQNAAARFIDTTAYRALVLHGQPFARVRGAIAAHDGIDARSIGFAIAALALAVIFAAIALFRDRLPAFVRRTGRLANRPLYRLDRFHSGDVRDYVTWLALGVAGLGAGFTAILAIR